VDDGALVRPPKLQERGEIGVGQGGGARWAGGESGAISTAQHNTAQHSTAQHSTAQHSTAPHSTAQHRAEQPGSCAALRLALPSRRPTPSRTSSPALIATRDCA
jgi:hypothetical protein